MRRFLHWVPTKSKSGGSKRSNKRNYSDKSAARELLLAEDGQQYARVTTRMGDGRFEVLCLGDGTSRLAHVRGKLWRRVWVSPHDLVLVSLRAFQDHKTDIVHKYTDDESRRLCHLGEVPIGASRAEDDDAHEAHLRGIRDVHGSARAGFLPTEAEFGFSQEVEDAGEDRAAEEDSIRVDDI